MTERRIQDALWMRLRMDGHNWMCPNYTPPGWWECDMFSVTKSGCMVEHEIKLTVSDFRADADKIKTVFNGRGLGWDKKNKHDLLGNAHVSGPTRFFYVVPRGLLTLDMLPTWAGLLEAREHGRQILFSTLRRAMKLHNEKVDPRILAKLGSTFYWRYWTARGINRDPGGPIEYQI